MANPNEFFLPPDEAQSLGNTEYMRKKVTIRRTFPKTASNKSTELIKEVSATTDRVVSKGGTFTPNNNFANNGFNSQPSVTENTSSETSETVQPSPAQERRSGNNSLDMFRNMARQIRK
jgi:hypothetical protein